MYSLSNVKSLYLFQGIRVISNAVFAFFYDLFTYIGHPYSLGLSDIVINESSVVIQDSEAAQQSVQQMPAQQSVQRAKRNLRPPTARFAPVAIIIPAYNEESCLSATLSSILEQSVVSEQIIVVDDASSDRTGEIAMSFDGVNVVRTPKNIGSKATALNYGLQHVSSKYTITVDADIKLEENAVNKLVELMETQPHVSGICTFILPNKTK